MDTPPNSFLVEMTVKTKTDVKFDAVTIPKGTIGLVNAVSNAEFIKDCFPKQERPADWFYICLFNGHEGLCTIAQLDFS